MTCYRNTDLDLVSRDDLSDLAVALEKGGISPLHVTPSPNGFWYATFETDKQYTEPNPNILQMLDVINSLTESVQSLWATCIKREFNIGYDCGTDPWAFNQGLSTELLRRLAEVGASIRITLYPYRSESVPEELT
ncbi:hypothetical protein DTL21_24025 [Bremerella cremea]|uniref:DUF4279 domain-containing protein n=2 Tax=Pirellulales TaxID=2691354 RepID=A0A2S8FE39_9BACT|nr:hypothetical protein C5Y83_23980 [Blastopirellula marina]RCS43778.1 hypothetical protein DTL21_24025 [Bremerella cremea]